MDARIGRLSSGKFYAFLNGYASPMFLGSLYQVEKALGLHPSVAKRLRTYTVTVAPKFKVYAGSWSNGIYTVEVDAYDRNQAISEARAAYKEENDVSATFTARLK